MGFEEAMRQAIGMDMGQLLSLPFIIVGIIFIVLKRPAAAGPEVSGRTTDKPDVVSGTVADMSKTVDKTSDKPAGSNKPAVKTQSRYEHYYRKK